MIKVSVLKNKRRPPLPKKDARHKNNTIRQYDSMINNFSKAPSTIQDIEFPPGLYIEILSKRAHSAIGTYLKLWRARNQKNIVYIYRDEIQAFFMRDTPKFLKELALIGDEGLLNWKEEKKITDDLTRALITIELIGWSDEDYD